MLVLFLPHITGDNVQQELDLHIADHGHDGLAPIPGHAAAQHFKRSRLHYGVFDHVSPVSRGAETHLGNHTRNQSIFDHHIICRLIAAILF